MTWDPASQAVNSWQGRTTSAEFREVLEAGLNALIEQGGSRWLSDCRNTRAVRQADQDWIHRDWFPRALAAGLRRMAVVSPATVAAQMNYSEIMGRVSGSSLDVDFFPTVEEATAWLLSRHQTRA